LIVFEGIDGSGKTTQAKILARRLNNQGLKASYSKEPTEGVIGRFIRQEVLANGQITDPRAVVLLYAADRSTHLNSVVFSDDVINIFDRFYYSSVAYQGALGVPIDYILKGKFLRAETRLSVPNGYRSHTRLKTIKSF